MRLRPGEETVCWARAGHPPPLRLPDLEELPADGSTFLLGAEERLELENTESSIAGSEGLVVYTDGATDVRRGKEMLGLDGLTRSAGAARRAARPGDRRRGRTGDPRLGRPADPRRPLPGRAEAEAEVIFAVTNRLPEPAVELLREAGEVRIDEREKAIPRAGPAASWSPAPTRS